MSNLVVFSFLSRRSCGQRQVILTRVMDRCCIRRFSTIPGENSPRNGLEGSRRDPVPWDTATPHSRSVCPCPQTCSPPGPGPGPAAGCAAGPPEQPPASRAQQPVLAPCAPAAAAPHPGPPGLRLVTAAGGQAGRAATGRANYCRTPGLTPQIKLIDAMMVTEENTLAVSG